MSLRTLMLFTLTFAGGCALAVWLLPGDLLLWAACAALLLWIALLSFRGCLPQIKVLAAGLAFGLLWCAGYTQLVSQPAWTVAGRKLDATAEVCSLPERKDYGLVMDAWVSLEDVTAKTRLTLYDFDGELHPGDVVAGVFTLRQANRRSDGTEYLYDQARGVQLCGYATVEAVYTPKSVSLRYLPLRLAETLQTGLRQAVPSDAFPFLKALLFGDKSELPFAQKKDLQLAGLSHVVAVSGLHVSILLLAVSYLVHRRKRLLCICAIPLILLFVLVTGASPSVVRAAVMQILLLLSVLLWRENDSPTTLSTAALLLLLQNPWVIANVSFQLSFAAFLGLMLLTPRLYTYFSELPWMKKRLEREGSRLHRLIRALVQGMLVTFCGTCGALLFTVPITALTFGTVTVWSALSNLLTFWIVNLCFLGGLLVIVTALVFPLAASVQGWLLAWPVRAIIGISGWIARLPMAEMTFSTPGVPVFLIAVYLLIGLWLLLRWKRDWIPLTLVLIGLIITCVYARAKLLVHEFAFAAVDVGQGQCICLRTPALSAMVDCGGSDPGEAGAAASAYLRLAGCDRIDALILTHYDQDHVNGLEELLRKVEVSALYLPDAEDDNRARVERLAADRSIPLYYVTEVTALPFSGGMLQIYPPAQAAKGNNLSLTVLCSVGTYDVLITGDRNAKGEAQLVETFPLPDVELLIAGHHGAKDACSEALLAAVRPETVFISVGRNSYGHPSAQTIDRLLTIGAEVFRTDLDGTLELRR